MATPDKANPRHEHAPENQAPGASGPGTPGYDGEATVGDEGAAANLGSYLDPTGTGHEMDPRIEKEIADNDPAKGIH